MGNEVEVSAKGYKFVLLHSDDNVLVCTLDCQVGDIVNIDDIKVCMNKDIEVGHKVARSDLEENSKIFKCGAPIGSLRVSVKRGEHVHSHNLKSDYIPSHTRYASGEK